MEKSFEDTYFLRSFTSNELSDDSFDLALAAKGNYDLLLGLQQLIRI